MTAILRDMAVFARFLSFLTRWPGSMKPVKPNRWRRRRVFCSKHLQPPQISEAIAMTRLLIWCALGAVLVSGIGFSAWLLSLPPGPIMAEPPAIREDEIKTTLDALRPSRRAR